MRNMRYTIDYGFGRAILHTPLCPEERFYALANTCWGIRKSIEKCVVLECREEETPDEWFESLMFNGDWYVWREDGARMMLLPDPEAEWDTSYCEEVRHRLEQSWEPVYLGEWAYTHPPLEATEKFEEEGKKGVRETNAARRENTRDRIHTDQRRAGNRRLLHR